MIGEGANGKVYKINKPLPQSGLNAVVKVSNRLMPQNVLKKYAASNVPLVMACSPRFRPNDNNQQMAELCQKYGIPFIDIYDTPYYNAHPELFKDGGHMNDDGAHIYTAIFFEQLKQYLPNL